MPVADAPILIGSGVDTFSFLRTLPSADLVAVSAALDAFAPVFPAKIGVAVSGGGDSVAALHLMAQTTAYRRNLGPFSLHAVTVDHGLRPEAAQEARAVAEMCAGLGISHETLLWLHPEGITGNLQDAARRARYRLIGDWARQNGIGHMVVGHTADDVAETFLMQLARSAGLDGLSGMRAQWEAAGIIWERPFLSLTRADLRNYLLRHNIGWVEDPSNADDRFDRVKARKALVALAPLGITVQTIGASVQHLAAQRRSMAFAVADIAERMVTEVAGALVMSRAAYLRLEPELQRRLLIAAIRWVARPDYAPRAEKIARLDRAIVTGTDATLSGCMVRVIADEVYVLREWQAVKATTAQPGQLWDGRWIIQSPKDCLQERLSLSPSPPLAAADRLDPAWVDHPSPDALHLRALGPDGLRACKEWRTSGLTRDTLLVTPSVWQGDTLIAAPMAGMLNGWKARIVTGFGTFVLSH